MTIEQTLARAGMPFDRLVEHNSVGDLPTEMYEDSRIGDHPYTDYSSHAIDRYHFGSFELAFEVVSPCGRQATAIVHWARTKKYVPSGGDVPVELALSLCYYETRRFEQIWLLTPAAAKERMRVWSSQLEAALKLAMNGVIDPSWVEDNDGNAGYPSPLCEELTEPGARIAAHGMRNRWSMEIVEGRRPETRRDAMHPKAGDTFAVPVEGGKWAVFTAKVDKAYL